MYFIFLLVSGYLGISIKEGKGPPGPLKTAVIFNNVGVVIERCSLSIWLEWSDCKLYTISWYYFISSPVS